MVGNFCCEKFWDTNETWNVEVPDFSSCFQDILLVFTPCLLYSAFGIFNLYSLSKNIPHHSLPWTWRVILKLVLGIFLFIISIVWCCMHIYKMLTDGDVAISTIIAAFSRSITYLIVIALMLKYKTHGITTSSVLGTFWICFAVCGALMHRSIIIKYSGSPDIYYILGMMHYPLIYIELILSFFADTKSIGRLEYGSPLEEETFISSITYMWFNRIVYRALKRSLTVQDFLPLAVKLKSSFMSEIFSRHWKFHSITSELQKQSLAWALLKSTWPWLLIGLILEILFVLSLLLPPIILDGILEFVKNDHYTWRSYFYCGAIFIAVFAGKTILNNYIMYLVMATFQIKSSLISAIFRKNLRISSSARKNYTSGSITNLISVDVFRISQFALYASALFCAPIRVILFLIMMWQYLGTACLAGVAVIVTLIPISFYMTRVSEKFTKRQMEQKDLRLKFMNEILQGIKILKFYAWELPFSSKVSKTRNEEIRLIRFSQLCYVITSFVFSCTPILVSIATFTAYLLIDLNRVLDPTTAFVSLNLLDQLRFALFIIPDGLSELIQTITSIKRIQTFLSSEEINPEIVGSNPEEGKAITFKQASFYWDEEISSTLENIDLNVDVGKLIAVIGPVGSGKSSLLSAILGEMYKSTGSIDVKGSIAYVPQEAWILNRTLKKNILLEKPNYENIYNKVLDCCCLRPDLEILPGGDGTEIGEKGINLSGGQKQRVSLARAVFQNKDIYLLDDPLSAVDTHVRKDLFENVVGNKGLLKNKTRVLVTHDISVLPYVDFIVRMDGGKILESGTYEELMDGNGSFLNFIKTHSGLSEETDSEKAASVDSAAGDKDPKTYDRTISEDLVKGSDSKHQADMSALIEEEKMEEGGVKRGIYVKYMKHLGWHIFAMALLGYAAFTAFEARSNIWVAEWSSDPVTNGTDHSQAIWRISVYGCLGAAQAFTIVMGTALMVYGSTRASALFHEKMLNSVLKSPMSFFDVTPMGRIINRFSTDMDTLDVHLIYVIDGWLTCMLSSISTFIVIGINTPIFLASLVPLGAVYYMFLRLHLKTSRQCQRLQSTTRSPIYSHMLESIYGVVSIKAFKAEKEFTEKLEESVDNHIACCFNWTSCNRWVHFWLDFIGSLICLIASALALQNRGNLGASFVGLVISYALSVTDSLMYLVRSNSELENKSVSIERIDEYCHLQSEDSWKNPDKDPAVTWPENGEILFDNYSTRYRENLDLVLKDINLNIHSNEKVGIIGRTGAGKSSVTVALFRIIEPAGGTIFIDNIDVSTIGLHTLRSKLTIIPQDPVLFTGSLRFNLDPNEEYEDSDIWQSLENSHLKEFVSSLADGLQHSIEESGGNLSAGQKQLLCLSRALLKKSKILILDEATAAVDMDTDRLVQDTIKTAFANHTVITIAHRLNTIMDYDKIVVMEAGSIAEVGNPANLLKNKNSQFYKMSKTSGLI